MWTMIAVLASRVAMWIAAPNACEDAYIYFRFAENLIHGGGVSMNPGQPVYGITSLPWLFLMVPGALIRHPVAWSRVLTLAIELYAAYSVDSQLKGWRARLTFAVLFACVPLAAALSASGLESSAFVATSLLLWTNRRWAAPWVATLRPEGIVIAAAWAWKDRSRWSWVAIPPLVVAGAGFLLTGDFLPWSMTAKRLVYGTAAPPAGFYWLTSIVPVYLGGAPSDFRYLLPLACLLLVSLFVTRSRVAWGAIAVIVLYALSGSSFFWWYAAIPLVAMLIQIPSLAGARGFRHLWIAAIAAVVLLAPSAAKTYVNRYRSENTWFPILTEQLQGGAAPGDTVLLEPIGRIGYETRLPVIDQIGLTDKAVVRERLAGDGWFTRLMAKRRPQWVIIRAEDVTNPAGFVGATKPFRSPAERDSIFAAYQATFGLRNDRAVLYYVMHRVR